MSKKNVEEHDDENAEVKVKQIRTKTPQFRIRVTPEERAQVIATAKRCKLSVSEFLRSLGLGYAPTSWIDAALVSDLMAAIANQGRLGGLLKMALADQKMKEEFESEWLGKIHRLLDDLSWAQRDIRRIIGEVFTDIRQKKEKKNENKRSD